MLKFIVLFFAAFAVFSPLFLIGIRKYTGRRAKRALGANIASFFAFLAERLYLLSPESRHFYPAPQWYFQK